MDQVYLQHLVYMNSISKIYNIPPFLQTISQCHISSHDRPSRGCIYIPKIDQAQGLVIKLFSCSTQLSTKLILLINVKMPTIVGILTFISMINTISERFKTTNFFICRYFGFYEQLKFRAQLS